MNTYPSLVGTGSANESPSWYETGAPSGSVPPSVSYVMDHPSSCVRRYVAPAATRSTAAMTTIAAWKGLMARRIR